MTYYVLATDGNRYGPVELDTLNLWAKEGRVIPASQIEESTTGRRIPAHEILGLEFPATEKETVTTTYPTDIPVYPGYYRGPQYGAGQPYPLGRHPSASQVTTAWVLGGVAYFLLLLSCCCSIGIIIGVGCSVIGMVLSHGAKQQGNPGANAAWVFNLVALILSILAGVASVILTVAMFGSSHSSIF